MATFVLVHGAYLGPWSRNLVVSSLNRRGHQAINIDLPINNGELGASDYADAVSAQLKKHANSYDEIVIVGHDIANLFIPLLSAQFAVKRFIYLAPFIPLSGKSIDDQINKQQASNMLMVSSLPDPITNRGQTFKYWLHDCDPDIASWAVSRSSKQNYKKLFSEISPVKIMPAINTSVIVCKNDRLINATVISQMSKTLLKLDALSIDSGHCPQLSRPQELALLLMQLGNMR
jgi:pimeloyl-ACP methyl ester carboxylesterase